MTKKNTLGRAVIHIALGIGEWDRCGDVIGDFVESLSKTQGIAVKSVAVRNTFCDNGSVVASVEVECIIDTQCASMETIDRLAEIYKLEVIKND